MGEFAGVLPDYHKPDIMNLINSYVVIPGSSTSGNNSGNTLESGLHQELALKLNFVPIHCVIFFAFRSQLATSLVQCLKAVADTYHPAILETTFPDALFISLVQLFAIRSWSKIDVYDHAVQQFYYYL